MASVASIAKAKALSVTLERLFGVQPRVEYLQTKSRVYFAPEDLPTVRRNFAAMSSKGPGDLEFDWLPVFRNDILKSALPYALGVLAIGYVLGKKL